MDTGHKRLVLSLAKIVLSTPGVHFNRQVRLRELFSCLTNITSKRLYNEAIYRSCVTADISNVIITTIKTMQILKSKI